MSASAFSSGSAGRSPPWGGRGRRSLEHGAVPRLPGRSGVRRRPAPSADRRPAGASRRALRPAPEEESCPPSADRRPAASRGLGRFPVFATCPVVILVLEGDIPNCSGKLHDPFKPGFRRLGILPQQLRTSPLFVHLRQRESLSQRVRQNETTRTTSPDSLVYKPNDLTGHQASIDLVLVSAPPTLMATFTASSIGSLKGTSIRSRPCS